MSLLAKVLPFPPFTPRGEREFQNQVKAAVASMRPTLAIHCETLQELTDYRRRTWGPGWFSNDRFIPSKRGKPVRRWCWP